MGFFRRISNAIARFMYGRNGADQLSFATLCTALVIDIISSLFFRRSVILFTIAHYASMALLLLTMFRSFSKNLNKRRAENQKFLSKIGPVQNNLRGARERHADKEHKYFTCRNCGTICRVPVGKGKIEITCPKCGAKIKGKS